ncbi:MAG TPA: DUF2169 domain-containing protein [Stellaceae bacterium]|nr:DUF2169 domain-containing protein [Stellaceae bacterium]
MQRITNLTPFPAGAKRTSRNPPASEMSLVVRGKFRLAPGEPTVLAGDDVFKQGPLTGDVFAEGDDDFTGPVAYASDFADFKPKTDILIAGDCCPPGGQPAVSCIATVMLGDWQKSLLAVGRRHWIDRSHASDPEPFLRMPITWENAYGGPGFAQNPVGLGWGEPRPDALLPTIGPAGDRVRMPEMTGIAASFRPLSPFWPQRRAKVGRNYGADYQRSRAPYFSDDFDWTHFNAAPEDQQLDGYLKGDEALRFVHLHSDAADFTATLPAIRIRAFFHKIAGPFGEFAMHLDTVLADLNEGLLHLTWRGLIPVTTDDFSDIGSVLVAQENLAGKSKDSDGYFPKLLEAEKPLTYGIHLLPQASQDALRAQFGVGEPATAAAEAEAAAGSGAAAAPPGLGPDPVTTFIKQKIAASPLAGMKTQAEQLLPQMVAKSDARGGPLRKWLTDTLAKTQAAAAIAAKPSSTPSLSPQAVAALKKIPDFLERMKAAAPNVDLSALKNVLNNPALTAMMPADPPEDEAEDGAPSGKGDLSGRDFSGRDLSRRDFSGMTMIGCRFVGTILTDTRFDGAALDGSDFTDARLERTNLARASMLGAVARNAVFDQAQLAGADLGGADFAGARFDMTSASGLKAGGLRLANAKLRTSTFSNADLTEADLSGAEIEQCDFFAAILERTNAAGSVWRQSPMNEAKLDGATMDGSILNRVAFRKTSAVGTSFARCALTNTGFVTADLSNAVFFECRGTRTNWQGSKLDDADFRRAVLPGALFMDVEGHGTNFDEADLAKARFRKAVLRSVTFVHAKLLRADFDRATIEVTRFDEANLFRARFYKVAGKTNSYDGAILSRLIVVEP